MSHSLGDFTRRFIRKRIGDCLADLDQIPSENVSGTIVAVQFRLRSLLPLLAEPAPLPPRPEMRSIVEGLASDLFVGGEEGRRQFLAMWGKVQTGEFEREETSRLEDMFSVAVRDIARST